MREGEEAQAAVAALRAEAQAASSQVPGPGAPGTRSSTPSSGPSPAGEPKSPRAHSSGRRASRGLPREPARAEPGGSCPPGTERRARPGARTRPWRRGRRSRPTGARVSSSAGNAGPRIEGNPRAFAPASLRSRDCRRQEAQAFAIRSSASLHKSAPGRRASFARARQLPDAKSVEGGRRATPAFPLPGAPALRKERREPAHEPPTDRSPSGTRDRGAGREDRRGRLRGVLVRGRARRRTLRLRGLREEPDVRRHAPSMFGLRQPALGGSGHEPVRRVDTRLCVPGVSRRHNEPECALKSSSRPTGTRTSTPSGPMLAARRLYPDAVACLSGSLNRNVREFYRLHADELDLVEASRLETDAIRRLIVVETVHASRLGRARAGRARPRGREGRLRPPRGRAPRMGGARARGALRGRGAHDDARRDPRRAGARGHGARGDGVRARHPRGHGLADLRERDAARRRGARVVPAPRRAPGLLVASSCTRRWATTSASCSRRSSTGSSRIDVGGRRGARRGRRVARATSTGSRISRTRSST